VTHGPAPLFPKRIAGFAWAPTIRGGRYKHPESFEILSVSLRDDSGKVRRTLLRDERAAWLQEGRAFRIMPSRARAEAGLSGKMILR
jgi:hypothetical protein